MNNVFIDIENQEGVQTWGFPAGEVHCKLSEESLNGIKEGLDIVVFNRCTSASDFLTTYMVIRAIRQVTPNPISLILPYLPYQQADRVFSEGEPLGLGIMSLFKDLWTDVYSLDVHSSVANHYCTELSSISKGVLEKVIAENSSKNTIFVLPDKGAYNRLTRLDNWAALQETNTFVFANKVRPNDGGEPIVSFSPEDLLKLQNKDIIVIDDICVGGRTFTNLIDIIIENGVKLNSSTLYVTHGVFSNGLRPLLDKFDKIITTNSFRDFSKINDSWVIRNEKLMAENKFQVININFKNIL